MIWSWVIPPLWPPKPRPEVWEKIFAACGKEGFDQVIDTDVEMEFHRPLLPGDSVAALPKLVDVTEEKQTGLGGGHFVTVESVYRNQKAELVCVQRVTLFIYKTRGKNEVS
jgi:hypothetical protein